MDVIKILHLNANTFNTHEIAGIKRSGLKYAALLKVTILELCKMKRE